MVGTIPSVPTAGLPCFGRLPSEGMTGFSSGLARATRPEWDRNPGRGGSPFLGKFD